MSNWKTVIKMTIEVLLTMAVLWLFQLSISIGLVVLSESIFNGIFYILLGISLVILTILICHDLAHEVRILRGEEGHQIC